MKYFRDVQAIFLLTMEKTITKCVWLGIDKFTLVILPKKPCHNKCWDVSIQKNRRCPDWGKKPGGLRSGQAVSYAALLQKIATMLWNPQDGTRHLWEEGDNTYPRKLTWQWKNNHLKIYLPSTVVIFHTLLYTFLEVSVHQWARMDQHYLGV